MAFVKFMGLTWPHDAMELLRISVQDVQRFRAQLVSQNARAQDPQPPLLVALELLQIPGRGRG